MLKKIVADSAVSIFAQELQNALHRIDREQELEDLRLAFLGRKGLVPQMRLKIKSLKPDERKSFGLRVNAIKNALEEQLNQRKEHLLALKISEKLREEAADIDLPVLDANEIGSLHPISLIQQKLHAIMKKLGYSILEGYNIDNEDYNFNKLNIKENHPARDMQDTFYLQNGMLLRTHTSNVQIHSMESYSPPMKIAAMGRCFRCDHDLTHTPMFHQLEGFVIDEGISFAHLKGTINTFLRVLFGSEIRTRFRPSYFPFVEPGGEVDMACVSCQSKGCRVCKKTGWVEIAGCGMIHPCVFEEMNIDSETYTGFAFGFGLDRLAMLYFGITDLRLMFTGNATFLAQFPSYI